MINIINGTKEGRIYNKKWFVLDEDLDELRYLNKNKLDFLEDYREYIEGFNEEIYNCDIDGYMHEKDSSIRVLNKF